MAEGDVAACFDAGNGFQAKLKDALSGLVKANADRKSEIDGLRGDHDQLKKDHDALEVTTTRENDLRKNEIKSLEEKQQKVEMIGALYYFHVFLDQPAKQTVVCCGHYLLE